MQMQIYNSCDILNINEGIRKMNYDLDRVWQWATGNGLSLNPSKSKSIYISRSKFEYSALPNIKINDNSIEIVNQVKNLEVFFNNDLSWSSHVGNIVGKLYGMLRTFWATQKYTPFHIKMLLAKTFLLPTLLYGSEMYGCSDSSDKYKLNILFNNITR